MAHEVGDDAGKKAEVAFENGRPVPDDGESESEEDNDEEEGIQTREVDEEVVGDNAEPVDLSDVDADDSDS